MLKIKVSSKRQATFPRQVCESLGVEPGDDLFLDQQVQSGKNVWVLRPAKELERPWLGSLRQYASGKGHDMESVRESITRGRKAGNQP